MKLSVLLMLMLPALSSAGLDNEHEEPVLFLDPKLENVVPNITGTENLPPIINVGVKSHSKRDVSYNDGQSSLEWQPFRGSLPNGAVSVYNGYVKRTDYVCQFQFKAGYYNAGMYPTPYCSYSDGGSRFGGYPFLILVNKDNFEFLEWKEGSHGSLPQNSVKTCTGCQEYVGYVAKNKYGLGRLSVKDKVFYLPWSSDEYWYRYYQVLTFSKAVKEEHLSDVKYKTDGMKTIEYPPETMRKTDIINRDCKTVTVTASLSKNERVEHRWDTSFSITLGAQTTITVGTPLIVETGTSFSASTTFKLSKGTTHIESTTHTRNIEHNVPPNHSCVVSMLGYKYGADIPYTARLRRTYRNGETTWTSISGTYRSVQMGEVKGVVDRCEPLPDPTPCP